MLPPVLDACCGSRSFWFDKDDERAIFLDSRSGEFPIDVGTPGTTGRSPIVVSPDVRGDFSKLPFPDGAFRLVVFDPPHIKRESNSGAITKRYGNLSGDWKEMIRLGFQECFRVLLPGGVLVFKWNEVEIPLSEILSLTEERPLFGNKTGRKAQTHWVCFLKPPT